MAAQPPPAAYPSAPGYPAQPGYDQPQYPDAYAGQGYNPDPAAYPQVDAYGQPIQGGYPPQANYAQQPPPYQPAGYVGQQTTQTQVTVVQAQPAVVTQQNVGVKPNNYIILSIVNLLCCFFILGVIALVFSLQVDSAWSSGNYEEARRTSNIAKVLNFIGIGIGVGVWVVFGIYVLAQIIVVAAVSS